MMRSILAAALLVSTVGASTSLAQTPPPPVEPTAPPRVQVGPVSLRPALILRDVGFDSNVFNRAGGPEGDYTATFGANVDVGVRSTRIEGTYTSFFEYLYFQTFESERGINRGGDGRMDFLLGRLRPYVAAGISRSHDRPNAEIDERAVRVQSSLGAGTTFEAFSRTKLNVGYRQTKVDYADDEVFRGVSLADRLNLTAEAVTFGVDLEMSPLTTLSWHGERAQDRFDLSPERDADSYRFGVTATLQPSALISGRASFGVRAFRPLSDLVREFTGVTAAVSLAYALRDRALINLTIDRDLRYSFTDETPYYISTGGRVTWTQQLFGNIDGQLFGGVDRIAYEARLDAVDAPDDPDDVRLVGGGFGYRVGDGSRVGINLDYATRTSPAADREYKRRRVYGTLTYGF